MPTPNYLGGGQPAAASNSSSLFGRLRSIFGGAGTPNYAGVGQPITRGGILAASSPAYVPAPAPSSTCDDCPVDTDSIDSGNIAIVIPHCSD